MKDITEPKKPKKKINKIKWIITAIGTTIGYLISAVLALAGTIFLILTIYSGILWMTARGDDAQVEKATNIIRRSAVGLIIVVAAYAITFFVVETVAKNYISSY